jgi:hypothetical protein
MLLEMLEMLERESKGSSNSHENDKGVARNQLLTARVGVSSLLVLWLGSASLPLHTFHEMIL